jgi:GAF domain-containing protein
MSRRRIGIFGVTDESLGLAHLLLANPKLDIARVWDADRAQALTRIRSLGPDLAATLESILIDDPDEFALQSNLDAVIDSDTDPGFTSRFPEPAEHGVQVVSPLTARLLWGYGVAARDRKGELLTALNEVVESVELTIDSAELFERMLDIAVGVTGADGGSLMLLDPSSQELRIRVAIGVEPELWSKIRVPIGEGIAGRVAADARPLRLRGKADRRTFQIVRERLDVESALCVPLVSGGRVLGVLNLHHSTLPDAFTDADLQFLEQLAHLDAQIIARAQEHESLRNQAARYELVRKIQGLLAGATPLSNRLRGLCTFVAESVGHGIATIFLCNAEASELQLAATSLEGGGFGGEYRVVKGQGVDGQVAQSRRPAFLREADGSLAYVGLPLIAGERLVGVLSVQAGSDPPRGRAAEETLLEMAAAVAEGIAQADREARMVTRATRANAINETGIRMLSTHDLDAMLNIATSSAAMILDADHAVIRLQDEQTRRYAIRSYFGSADGPLQETLFRLDKTVSVETIRRRSPRNVRDIASVESLAPEARDVRSLLSAPIKNNGRVIGILNVYDKVTADRFQAISFSDDDFQVFTRFVSYVEQATQNAMFHVHTRQHRNFDEDTGLPNATYFGKRVQEEIARCLGREGALAVAVCCIENLEEIAREANPAHAHRLILRLADALRSHLRDFDVLGRISTAQFAVLMPEPGLSPGERVFEVARAVADEISREDSLNDPVRVALAFGYAVHPGDGADCDTLLVRATAPRIRMV